MTSSDTSTDISAATPSSENGSVPTPEMPTMKYDFNLEYQKLQEQIAVFQQVLDPKANLAAKTAHYDKAYADLKAIETKYERLIVEHSSLNQSLSGQDSHWLGTMAAYRQTVKELAKGMEDADAMEHDLELCEAMRESARNFMVYSHDMIQITRIKREVEEKGKLLEEIKAEVRLLEGKVAQARLSMDAATADVNTAVQKWQDAYDKIKSKQENMALVLKPATRIYTAEDVQGAFDAGAKKAREDLIPLAQAGWNIRNRHHEWNLDRGLFNREQDKGIIELGDQASHYGMALADSCLYTLKGYGLGNSRINPRTFCKLYEKTPQEVLQLKRSSKLLHILDWYGTLKVILKGYYPSDEFRDSMRTVWRVTHGKTEEEIIKFFEGEEGRALFRTLKAEHDTELQEHRTARGWEY
ncbi:hypothetical protein BP6252_02331 [Coleophoma cylindrospora]|uniref:Uncharacterized protein n=1 Tax=Coleophoma cylindrospora TaxID=1849047 RepID=A0A3D8SEW1_9HELO|nr:hypothetical protein BP6252_02331 [Coleophoma cylindrospora]